LGSVAIRFDKFNVETEDGGRFLLAEQHRFLGVFTFDDDAPTQVLGTWLENEVILEVNIGPVTPSWLARGLKRVEPSDLFYLVVNQVFHVVCGVARRLISGTRHDFNQLSLCEEDHAFSTSPIDLKTLQRPSLLTVSTYEYRIDLVLQVARRKPSNPAVCFW
jgi:hypothetical protein